MKVGNGMEGGGGRRPPPGTYRVAHGSDGEPDFEGIRVTLSQLVEAVASLTDDPHELSLVVDHILQTRATWDPVPPSAQGEFRVVVIERDGTARHALARLLGGAGVAVPYVFGEPQIAFFFLLARATEVDAIVVNEDDDGARALLRRIEVIPASPPLVTYSRRSA